MDYLIVAFVLYSYLLSCGSILVISVICYQGCINVIAIWHFLTESYKMNISLKTKAELHVVRRFSNTWYLLTRYENVLNIFYKILIRRLFEHQTCNAIATESVANLMLSLLLRNVMLWAVNAIATYSLRQNSLCKTSSIYWTLFEAIACPDSVARALHQRLYNVCEIYPAELM